MDDKVQTPDQPQEEWPSSPLRFRSWPFMVLAMLACYVISAGPVSGYYYVRRLPAPRVVLAFYSPLVVLYKNVPPFRPVMDRLLRAWSQPLPPPAKVPPVAGSGTTSNGISVH